jgi:hypothetical protein
MSYKIAYGVNTELLRNRKLFDSLVAATFAEDEVKLQEIIASLLPNKADVKPVSKSASLTNIAVMKPVAQPVSKLISKQQVKPKPFEHLRSK